MQIDTFSNRLKKALSMNNMSQTELANKTKIDKSLISNYLSGNYKAKQENLSILSETLDVSEPWLMGYDVDVTGIKERKESFNELEILFLKNRDILTEEDEETIKFLIEKRKKQIDKELGENEN